MKRVMRLPKADEMNVAKMERLHALWDLNGFYPEMPDSYEPRKVFGESNSVYRPYTRKDSASKIGVLSASLRRALGTDFLGDEDDCGMNGDLRRHRSRREDRGQCQLQRRGIFGNAGRWANRLDHRSRILRRPT
jgi:hypothetical protein